ncbi:hypothetical protein P8C59_008738 [Phyllachora maydis]|uniref:Uncharacterized protein n=1 Tax=Phyllachora maydis TaxID=1825666 RepID=A0AAD9IB84_9PEZI|nr:hypothetical protein P8C59_008738 [Phyllachora maydis]
MSSRRGCRSLRWSCLRSGVGGRNHTRFCPLHGPSPVGRCLSVFQETKSQQHCVKINAVPACTVKPWLPVWNAGSHLRRRQDIRVKIDLDVHVLAVSIDVLLVFCSNRALIGMLIIAMILSHAVITAVLGFNPLLLVVKMLVRVFTDLRVPDADLLFADHFCVAEIP